ncbi:MAG TPA: aldose epimerase family protein [Anaerohalosphaeraceae bacterium]|jgi:aldose 1-epimerase|nr:aldose epimerase family protein [Anaerohalosphaeraceae bacterium]HRT51072.1 aldose epimerase family protein [Anaerohalosphaeraceae bacterium]HRT87087.1 aldose epimerase family protein [Anaerohalosphaeraceae bacterium]
MTRNVICIALAFTAITCMCAVAAESAPTATGRPWGQMADGTTVNRFDLKVGKMEVGVIEYGATLVSIRVPDKRGKIDDVLLGFDNLEDYFNRNFGGVTGRFANRIGGAKFTLDGVEYKVTANSGPHHIHGGRKGFDKQFWKGEPFTTDTEAGVRLTYLSKDGEEGYPGNLNVTVTYTVRAPAALEIHYEATTDKPTVINLTNHAYFNLAGAGSGSVRDHIAVINADHYTVADDALIPTGEIRSVEGTPLDFRPDHPRRTIGQRIDQLTQTRGYDHNYVLNSPGGAAGFLHPPTGRSMLVYTTEPGMQFYTANHLRDLKGRDGKVYNQHGAFCVETQHYPDSPNKPNYPSVVLRPGEKFDSKTVFAFPEEMILPHDDPPPQEKSDGALIG